MLAQRIVLHDLREEIVENEPLVVPRHQPPRLLEQVSSAGREMWVLLQQSHEAVVQLRKRDVHLRDEEVFVVAIVDDDRSAMWRAREIVEANRGCRPGPLCRGRCLPEPKAPIIEQLRRAR